MIARRAAFLTDYQDAAYAKRYTDFVAKVRAAETARLPGKTALTEAVARYYFKLLAIKDEYEVARLYTDGDFVKRVAAQFEGDYKLNFHLAPPLSNKPDPVTGEAKKSTYGPWMMTAFRVLAKMKWLRGTALDVFGKTHERRDRAPADHRLRSADRRALAAARRAQSRDRGRARLDPRAHSRVRPRQGSPSEGGEGEGSRAGGELSRRGARCGGGARRDQGGGLMR